MNKYQIERFLRNAKNNFNYHLRNIPVVTRYLLISIIVVFILQHVVNLYFFVLQSFNYGFNPVQLISYAFLHGNFAHLLFNGLALWMFGSQIERYWGAKRYLTFVFVCIVGAAITHMIFVNANVIGISGLVFGLLLAYGMMWPEREIFLLLPPMPVKAKYLVIGYGVLLLLNILTSRNDGIAHFAHLGGALSGFLLIQYWRKKPPFHR
ncbi:MAG TPA: rhomboid family intramembrane serine protease [Gammaproteobacteria bacterium]|jgi:membrane associated rhomboid family serine protease|nr:rhomboid family intramembrane serine protease [Xanthomonadales bacterium]HOP21910.1 rhomboid family intramembrane serine protease [Gammaproteobacteria bacterium]HPI96248.1 rhomboid family intramembrane serine protease [Gammaproteobacteria bacterium]HPQ87132.1 rhomboid family intramembrane serine protease [Gammaproteobacteria bacterium]